MHYLPRNPGLLWRILAIGKLMKAVPATFYLIRHGEIDANVERRWHGSTDSELNKKGRQQAERLANHIATNHPEISAVYHSPLRRTRHTAIPLAKKLDLDPRPEENLREYSIGELENTPYEELHTRHDFFANIAENQDFAPPGGESPNEVCVRMIEAFTRLGNLHQGREIAMVSHGAAMGIALSHLLEHRVYPFHTYHMANTGYSKLIWSAEPKLEIFNACEHLDGLPGYPD